VSISKLAMLRHQAFVFTQAILVSTVIATLATSSVSAADSSVTAMDSDSAVAVDSSTDSMQAGGTGNPYSPRYGHPYRHGVMPTLDVHAAMQKWAAAHQPLVAAATGTETLSYGGANNGVGVLSGHAKVYLVFYGSQWGTKSTDGNGNATFSGDAKGAAPVAQQMFKGVGTGSELWSAELTQWCDGPNVASGATSCPTNGNFIPYQSGGVLAGVWYDNSVSSPSGATGNQLGQEAVNAAAHFGNTTAASNRYAYYVIMSPTGTNPDAYQGAYCAWHDWTGDTSLSGGGAVSSPYGDIAFSNQPYNMDSGAGCGVGFVNSPGTLDGYTMTLGHEWHEMMSDQFPAGGWTNHTGNATYNGQENSDECAWIAAGATGGAANITFGNGTYTEQASWSNDTNSCAISHPIVGGSSGGGTPVANFGYTANALVVSFTDSSTDSGGTLSAHAWTFGDGGTSTATNPSHTYAAAGTYSVAEKVTDSVSGTTNTKTVSLSVTGGTGGGGNVLSNNVAVTGLSGATGVLSADYTFTVPTGATAATVAISGGTGDADMYVQVGVAPTLSSYSCRPYVTGNTESCALTAGNTYHIKINGYAAYSGVSLIGKYTAGGGGGGGNVLSNNVAVTGLSGATGVLSTDYTFTVPAGATAATMAISGGSGDADLYVQVGAAPTLSSYSCRPYLTGNNESCALTAGNTYHVKINAYAAYSGVSLVGSYTP
jgi:serine protease